jgi:hypothetical protein
MWEKVKDSEKTEEDGEGKDGEARKTIGDIVRQYSGVPMIIMNGGEISCAHATWTQIR